MIRVVKRSGRVEALDVSKIQKYTSAAVEGLGGVSQSELEVDAQLLFQDMIKTEQIQEQLIKTAVDKIDIDRPNWTFVAARLFLYDLYHKVSGFTGYLHLREYFERGEKAGRILLGLKEKYDLDDLNDYIKPERDLQFTYLGIRTLYDRYLIKDQNGNPIELPQHLFMGVAMFLAQNEFDCQGWAKRFYDVLSKFEAMVATPTLSNARTPRHQLSSCYVGSTPDNIEGIFDSYKEMALLSKFGGGIGWDWTRVRGIGSYIDGHKNAAGGTIPFLKIANDVAIAVDQLGTRKGAIAVYMEPWHIDIRDFLDLKKNAGEERRRAHDLFPALWINDLFMERVAEDKLWTLFDPYDVPELTELHGEEFREKYEEVEAAGLGRDTVSAKQLWKEILRSYFETGNPFLCFKDSANRCNPNGHKGVIRSSNLCTEIFQNTSPNRYLVEVALEGDNPDDMNPETENTEYESEEDRQMWADAIRDGDFYKVRYYEEDEIVKVDGAREGEFIEKPAKKITSVDSIGGRKVWMTEKVAIDGETAVCNLASLNLSKIHTKEDIERVVPVVIRMLDNVIDLNLYPLSKVKRTNLSNRAIGMGVMGEAQMLAEAGIEWGSDEHLYKIDEVMEMVSYNAIRASSNLAVERGRYPNFEGSDWSRGIFPIDKAKGEVLNLTPDRGGLFGLIYDWQELKDKVKRDGMRNGYLMAIAPTSSISILTGTTQAIEPVYKRKWYEENLSGVIPVVVPNLSASTWNYYVSAYDLDQRLLIRAGAVRQKWIDQGQSLNIFIRLDQASGKYLNDIYMEAWRLGLKSTYYLRSQSPEALRDDEGVLDRSMECQGGCQ